MAKIYVREDYLPCWITLRRVIPIYIIIPWPHRQKYGLDKGEMEWLLYIPLFQLTLPPKKYFFQNEKVFDPKKGGIIQNRFVIIPKGFYKGFPKDPKKLEFLPKNSVFYL